MGVGFLAEDPDFFPDTEDPDAGLAEAAEAEMAGGGVERVGVGTGAREGVGDDVKDGDALGRRLWEGADEL